jgi:heme/copper-type cytochrome/quinol oxidase subunit 2
MWKNRANPNEREQPRKKATGSTDQVPAYDEATKGEGGDGGTDEGLEGVGLFETGILIMGVFTAVQIVATVLMILLVAASLGGNLQSVTSGSIGWWTIAFYFFSVNLQMLGALMIASSPNLWTYRVGMGGILLGAASSLVAFILMAVTVTNDANCFAQSYCTEFPPWVPTTVGQPPPLFLVGTEQDAFTGAKWVLWSLFFNLVIAIAFAIIAGVSTSRWHTGNKALQKAAAESSIGKPVGFMAAAVILVVLFIAVVLLILGGRQGGTPQNINADRESPGAGEAQWWAFTLFVIFGAGLPAALLFTSFQTLDNGSDGARQCSMCVVAAFVITGLFFSFVYAINIFAVSQNDLCCVRLDGLAGANHTNHTDASYVPPESTIDRNFPCGSYRANDLAIPGRNTYCGWVVSYKKSDVGMDNAEVRIKIHGDFTAATLMAIGFAVLSSFMACFAVGGVYQRSPVMSDRANVYLRNKLGAGEGEAHAREAIEKKM